MNQLLDIVLMSVVKYVSVLVNLLLKSLAFLPCDALDIPNI